MIRTALSALLLAISGPAFAAPPRSDASAELLAQCIVSADNGLAQAIMELGFLSPPQVEATRAAARRCGRELAPGALVDVADVVGRAARRLYLERFASGEAADRIGEADDAEPMGRTSQVGDCMVRINRQRIGELLDAERGSATETRLLDELRPSATRCGWNPARLAEPTAFGGLLLASAYRVATQGPALCSKNPKKAAAQGLSCRATYAEGGLRVADDYPVESRKYREEGTSYIAYEVDVRGRVTPRSCRILASSGHARLDARTCEIFEKRFRFNPALHKGAAVSESRVGCVGWRL